MKKFIALFMIVSLINVKCIKAQENEPIKDTRDNKVYKTVKLGKQVWFMENLNYSTKNGSWCYEKKTSNCEKYGRLYNWETAKKACPNGWHLPSQNDWNQLSSDSLAGKKLINFDNAKNKILTKEESIHNKWWTSTEDQPGYAAKYWLLLSEDFSLFGHANLIGAEDALSIRCLKD